MEERKTALVTGASGGIGLELAKLFAKDGCDLVLVARSEKKLQNIKTAIEKFYDVNVRVFVQDLSAKDAALNVYEYTKGEGLFVEYLVNNAGFGDHGEFAEADWQKQHEMINLNVTALTQMTYLYLKDMKEQGTGRILNLASAAAFGPGPYMSVYYATKAYVKSFSEAVYEEMKDLGITVTALCLGPATTGFWNAAGFGEDDLTKRLNAATPKDVAKTGYKAMMKGKALANHGLSTKALNLGSRLVPDSVIRKVVKKVNK